MYNSGYFDNGCEAFPLINSLNCVYGGPGISLLLQLLFLDFIVKSFMSLGVTWSFPVESLYPEFLCPFIMELPRCLLCLSLYFHCLRDSIDELSLMIIKLIPLTLVPLYVPSNYPSRPFVESLCLPYLSFVSVFYVFLSRLWKPLWFKSAIYSLHYQSLASLPWTPSCPSAFLRALPCYCCEHKWLQILCCMGYPNQITEWVGLESIIINKTRPGCFCTSILWSYWWINHRVSVV